MKKKDWPVLITYKHEGLDIAKKVIDALRDEGLKKGDTVSLEVSKKQLDFLINRWLARHGGFPIKPHKSAEVAFMDKIFDFLMELDVDVLPFSSSRVEKHVVDRVEKQDKALESGKKVSRKYKRLTEFMLFPIREKFFIKRLRDQNPKFVLGGNLHLPALRKVFPYSRVVNVVKPRLGFRLTAKMSRLHYRTIKRIKAEKRKPRKSRP